MTVVSATDRTAGVAMAREPRNVSKTSTDTAREQSQSRDAQKTQSTPPTAAASSDGSVRFHVDEDSGKTVVAWVDGAGKVLKQLPTEEAMAVAKAIDKFQGVFLNRKA